MVEGFGVKDEFSVGLELRVECVDDARTGDNVREMDSGCVLDLEE